MLTATFPYTGAAQSWVVPANVHAIDIEAWGAQGGSGKFLSPLTPGGEGGYSKGTLGVTPGETLHVYVGGQGQNVTTAGPVGGGFNGGGGGTSTAANLGGAGGGSVGADGTDVVPEKGFGGTQTAGGVSTNCNPGVFFAGGNTIDGKTCSGGGGGWYGGGAGGGAGGGSGYVGGVLNGFTNQSGRQGNGLVIFRIDAALQCPKDVCIVTSRCSFPVYYTVKGQGTGEIICTPPSGSCFPQGTTRVDCYAQLDRSVKCHFFVTVRPPR